MKLLKNRILPAIALLMFSTGLLAQTPEADESEATKAQLEAIQAEEAQEHEELQRVYSDAVEAARAEQKAALEAVERARTEMLHEAEEQARMTEKMSQVHSENAEEYEQAREMQLENSAAMREELSRAHESLRHVSREVARAHRDINRSQINSRIEVRRVNPRINLGDKAIIGVVLGESENGGVPVLGVSPDGPADRAGMEQGDIIISMMGESLSDDDEGDARAVLSDVMDGVAIGDEIVITVDRDDETHDFIVVADKREPFAWQSIVRLPSAPTAATAVQASPSVPSAPVIIERINIPDIDEEALRVEVERIRADVDRARVLIESSAIVDFETDSEWDYKFESLSDFGDGAIREANVWFGLPLTKGLKLAEVDEGLGEYFNTDRGVLVLEAKPDNDLQLESGDVILDVGSKNVDKPSDVMRALRDWESGETIEINVKRNRKNKSLDVVLPERTHGYQFVPSSDDIHIKVLTDKD